MKDTKETNEYRRLNEPHTTPIAPWRRWGPYVSERAWGTVREDYSPDGAAWDYFPHDKARSKAYRWGEDGLAAVARVLAHGAPRALGEIRPPLLPWRARVARRFESLSFCRHRVARRPSTLPCAIRPLSRLTWSWAPAPEPPDRT